MVCKPLPFRNSRPLHHRTAFTLIELLVVIAIISLLVSILLPSLQKAKGLAISVVCMCNLRNAGFATQQYISDSDGSFPPGGYQSNSTWWKVKLSPYLNTVVADPDSPWINSNWSADFACPAVSGPMDSYKTHIYDYRIGKRSYTVESKPTDRFGISGWSSTYEPIAGKVKHILRPTGDVAWIAEGKPKQQAGIDSMLYNSNSLFYQELDYRHEDVLHVLWADWHVSPMDDLERSHFYIRD